MKRIVFILAFLLPMLISASPEEGFFKKANSLYAAGDYERAMIAYNEVLKSGHESAALYLNMGDASFRLNRLGYAVLFYEKALKLDPSDRETAFNLRLTKTRLKENPKALPEIFVIRYFKRILALCSANLWSLFLLVSYAGLLLSIYMFFFSGTKKNRRRGFFSAILCFSLFFCAAFILLEKLNINYWTDSGVILKDQAPVLYSPEDQSAEVFKASEGLKFEIMDSLGDYYKIRLSDGRTGWVDKGSTGSI